MFWLNETFEIWWNGKRKKIPKEVVEQYLAQKVNQNATGCVYVNASDKCVYSDVCHFMLRNLKDAVRIQIYRDGAVRVYLMDIFMRYSAMWDTPQVYESLYNLGRLDEFILFVENYK